jgi:phospholipid/cholesterol/gamma-HCH transport system permease protein
MYIFLMKLPNSAIELFSEAGELTRFTLKFYREVFRPRFEWKEFIRQCYVVGYKSFPLIALTGFIMGMVFTIQVRPTLVQYGVEARVPAMMGLSFVREIGPVVSALIFAGKIGSSIGAELGSMRVTEQIDAMEVSGTNPYKFLVVTRVLACTLMLPVLTSLSDVIGLYGSFVAYNIRSKMTMAVFMEQIFHYLHFSDVIPAYIKAYLFGFAVSMVGCFKGYHTRLGTAGVGRAANAAVVLSSVLIFIIDMLVVQLTDLLGLG